MPLLKPGSLPQRSVSYAFSMFEDLKSRLYTANLKRVVPPVLEVQCTGQARFKHSGNAGDIVYALPAMRSLAAGLPLSLHLKLDTPAYYGKRAHPLGNVTFNQAMFDRLRPLLAAQPGVAACEVWQPGQAVDWDMDRMRDYPFPQQSGHIARWYFLTFAVNADLGQPWLFADPAAEFSDAIVLARSQRYHAPSIDHAFLSAYPRVVFVGVEAEFAEMRQRIPRLEYQPVRDFLELARVIAGARLFIGNQSFPFSVAEALKVRRLLEVCHLCPNVIPEGPQGYDFCYQPQFELLVRRLMA
ncbi:MULTISPECIES: hypothetical protein [Ramlibacter]|uniref:DUF4417 domain-containing protein n=1 Tax=Ramlibacter aquaticus TaxID=2780094 RepID=A0ABR9SAQ5_9BURK|nr:MULTISPECIES: hypothetical protein [Ramlibacter]MBE7939430.1 hypothetical protein [Ramlibacter aquaticus]